MPAKGDEVAEKIEAQVREAIGKMVSDMRSSIEDVRDAVVQQLQAAMQSVQADANAMSLRSQLQQSLRGLAEPAAAAAAPERAPAGAEISSVKRAIQSIERGTSQIDVLNSLLEQSLNFGSRAALLILKGDTFSGWKATGFSSHGGNDENVKRFSASASSVPELDQLLRQEKVVAWNGTSLTSRFAASPAKHAVIIPMVIKDKVAAALYVDAFDASKFNRGALELLVFTTGLLVDTLTIRKKIPSPTLTYEETDATQVVSELEPFAEVTVLTEPEPPPRPAAPRPAPARPAAPPAPPPQARPTRQFEIESEASAARRPAAVPADSFATTAIPAFTPPPPPRPAAPPQAPASSVAELSERSTTQYIPPAGVKGGARFAQPQTEDVKKHDEARRFARLLVSEIKLYNESKVDQGRKHKDIYERLKEDIDRSRQMYDERIPENVRKSSNYFYDELVRILADGDADALGL